MPGLGPAGTLGPHTIFLKHLIYAKVSMTQMQCTGMQCWLLEDSEVCVKATAIVLFL